MEVLRKFDPKYGGISVRPQKSTQCMKKNSASFENQTSGLTCRGVSKKLTNKYIKNFVIFHWFVPRPSSDGFAVNLVQCRRSPCNHMWQFLVQSIERCRFCIVGRILAFPIDKPIGLLAVNTRLALLHFISNVQPILVGRIATSARVAWSVGLSVSLKVGLSQSWVLQKRVNVNRWRCHLGCGLGCDQGTMYVLFCLRLYV